MKTLTTLLLTAIILTGCANSRSVEIPTPKTDAERLGIEVITIDSCEYLSYKYNNTLTITPKRNCKNCIRIVRNILTGE